MPWGRWFHGHVKVNDLIHSVYINAKDQRMYWDSQCYIVWGNRDNYRRDIKPKTTRKPVTCFACLGTELKVGGWIERTSI